MYSINYKKQKKILIVRRGSIGDVLVTTPFIRMLKNNYPSAKISYMVGEWSKPILENNPCLNELISYKDGVWLSPFKHIREKINFIIKLRKKRFDLIFFLDGSSWLQYFLFFSGISNRVGFNKGWKTILLNNKVNHNRSKYLADYFIDLLQSVNIKKVENKGLELFISKKDMEYANRIFKTNNVSEKDLIVGIVPGGTKNPGQTAELKRWSLLSYIKLITKLTGMYDAKIILFGDNYDIDIGKRIINKSQSRNVINLIGKTTLKEAAATIKKCSYFITHDTGLLHVAAAMRIRTISLFGPTDYRNFSPKGKKNIVISKNKSCSPCYNKGKFADCKNNICMKDITIEEVLDKIGGKKDS